MSRREKEKRSSLDALAKFAFSSGAAAPAPRPVPPPAPRPQPAPRAPAPAPAAQPMSAQRRRQMEDRRAKIVEEQSLRARREGELARSGNLEWRGMDRMGVPASIRRTGFDRDEPTLAQKVSDILGDPREKDGRAKNREKGKRQGG